MFYVPIAQCLDKSGDDGEDDECTKASADVSRLSPNQSVLE